MPQIKDYSAPASIGINPTDRGTDAAAGTARRVGSFFNQVGGATQDLGSKTAQLGNTEAAKFAALGRDASSSIQAGGDAYVQYEDHKQISAGAAKFAEIQAGLTEKWNQFAKNADPNDTTVGAKFNETVLQPTLDSFKEAFSTEKSQAWAESHANALQLHMQQKASADMSTLAGIAVRTNAERLVNGLSSAVASDPSSLDFSLKTVESSIGAIVSSSPTLDATTAASVHSEVTLKAKEAIVKSAVSGMITKNPGIDLDAIQKKYGEYINGGEMKMFQRAAQTQARSDEWTKKQLETAQRKETETRAAAELSDNWTKNVTYDEAGQVHVNPRAMQNILDIEKKYPGAATADSQKMIGFLQAQQREKREVVNSDQAVRGDLITRFSSPDNFPTEIEILRAQAEHKLSSQDAREMLALQKAIVQRPGGDALKRDHAEFFKQYGPTIDPEMKLGNPTPLGAQNVYRAQMDAYRQEEALRAKGLDPHLVYDPRSEYFFGNPKNIGSYRPTMQDQANYKAQLATDKARTGPARNDTMPAIPAADQRPAGTIYDTPKGKLKWTGTGWVNP